MRKPWCVRKGTPYAASTAVSQAPGFADFYQPTKVSPRLCSVDATSVGGVAQRLRAFIASAGGAQTPHDDAQLRQRVVQPLDDTGYLVLVGGLGGKSASR